MLMIDFEEDKDTYIYDTFLIGTNNFGTEIIIRLHMNTFIEYENLTK